MTLIYVDTVALASRLDGLPLAIIIGGHLGVKLSVKLSVKLKPASQSTVPAAQYALCFLACRFVCNMGERIML
jgi:hypothetical protein